MARRAVRSSSRSIMACFLSYWRLPLARRYGQGEGYLLFNNVSMFQDALRFEGILESAESELKLI